MNLPPDEAADPSADGLFIGVVAVAVRKDGQLDPETEFASRRAWTGTLAWLASIQNADPAVTAETEQFDLATIRLRVPESAAALAQRLLTLGKSLRDRFQVELKKEAAVLVHIARRSTGGDPDPMDDPLLTRCMDAVAGAPAGGLFLTEEVHGLLTSAAQDLHAPLGEWPGLPGSPLYVFPRSMVSAGGPGTSPTDTDLRIWDAVCRYSLLARHSQLRYVGYKLRRPDPPSLPLEIVFQEPRLRTRTRSEERLAEFDALDQWPAEGDGEDFNLRENSGRFADSKASHESERSASSDEEVAFRGRLRLMERMERAEEPPRPLREVLAKHRHLVVLGDPGSGKSTLLRWLALLAARGRASLLEGAGLDERLLPLLVSLGRLAEIRKDAPHLAPTDLLARYLHLEGVDASEAELAPFLRRCLDEGSCFLLLDGLDESQADERRAMADLVETIAGVCSRNRVAVTSRLVGYPGVRLPDVAETVLEPFDDAQVERFVRVFCREFLFWESNRRDDGLADRTANSLIEAIRAAPALRGLTRNPFLLSGLALVHRAEGELPRHRVRAYHVLAEALCETWSRARSIAQSKVTPAMQFREEGIPVLGRLALRMHESFPTGAAPREFVLDSLAQALQETRGVAAPEARRSAEEFLRKASQESGILVERGRDAWGFPHLTFQEFFAAAGLLAMEEFEERPGRPLFDPRWEEVWRLGVGKMALVDARPVAAAKFIKAVLDVKRDGRAGVLLNLVQPQVALATILAAEAGETLDVSLANRVASAFASWPLLDKEPGFRVLAIVSTSPFREVVLRELVGALQGESWSVRAVAAMALGRLGSHGALKPLVGALEDNDVIVRTRAAEALGRLENEKALNPLAGVLGDEDLDVRTRVAQALGHLGNESSLEHLVEALKDEDSIVRMVAADALGRRGTMEALQLLVGALKDEDSNARMGAAHALGRLGSEKALEPLVTALKDHDVHVRMKAAEALSRLGTEEGFEPLEVAMKDEDSRVRMVAAHALGRLGTERALEPLVEGLKDENWPVRVGAAEGLGLLGAESAMKPLVEALKDKHGFVRMGAAEALGRLGNERALEPLVGALKDEKPIVRRRAAEALGRLGTPQAWEPLLALATTDSEIAREPIWNLLRSHPEWVALPSPGNPTP